MRKKVIVANWKMNEGYQEGLNLFGEVVKSVNVSVLREQEIVFCSPFIHLHRLAELSRSYTKVSIGAQNLHEAENGAFTGEISAEMIRSTGAEYVIVGHSERRKYFNETNQLIAKKTDVALKYFLKPIVCIGESKKERDAGQHFRVLKVQLSACTFHLSKNEFAGLVIAYEPVWAIGTGVTASPEQAQEMHKFIREQIAVKYSQEISDKITLLYGGSCSADNAEALFSQPDIDGGLIGGESLNSRDFISIITTLPNLTLDER